LPFEFSGAVSRWRIELPQENNQFDVSTLSDLVMHFNYTSREGGHEMRRIANERSQRHLSEGGIKFFDLQHEFPDIFAMLLFKSEHKKHTDLPLCFRRNQFPFLTGRRAVNVTRIEIFIELLEHVEVGQHINIQFIPTKSPPHMEVDCIISSYMPHFYLGSFHTNIGPIIGDLSHEYGRLRVPQCLRHINQFYFICHYTTHAKDCCTCGDRKGGCSAQV
jgi:hypothetical protein